MKHYKVLEFVACSVHAKCPSLKNASVIILKTNIFWWSIKQDPKQDTVQFQRFTDENSEFTRETCNWRITQSLHHRVLNSVRKEKEMSSTNAKRQTQITQTVSDSC